MKAFLAVIAVLIFSSPAFAMLEMTCEREHETSGSHLILKAELDQNGSEIVTLTEYFSDRTVRQQWVVTKKKLFVDEKTLSSVIYADAEAAGAAMTLTVDMSRRLEYAVYRSLLTLSRDGQARTENVLCGFFYHFP